MHRYIDFLQWNEYIFFWPEYKFVYDATTVHLIWKLISLKSNFNPKPTAPPSSLPNELVILRMCNPTICIHMRVKFSIWFGSRYVANAARIWPNLNGKKAKRTSIHLKANIIMEDCICQIQNMWKGHTRRCRMHPGSEHILGAFALACIHS